MSRKRKQKAEEEVIEHIRFFFEDALRTTPHIPCAARLSLGRPAEEARGARRQAARRLQLRQHQRIVLRRRRHRRSGRRAVSNEWGEQMGTNHFNHPRRDRQHAALEGGEESEPDCPGRHSAHADAHAGDHRVAAEVRSTSMANPFPAHSSAKFTPSTASRPSC